MNRLASSAMTLVGKTIGPYQVLDEIGRGGMGIVYRALDPTLGRHVALKVLPDAYARDAAFVERFRREARTAAHLEHPRLVTIYQVGEDNGRHYIAMQFVVGKNLEQVMREEGRLHAPRALEIARQTAQALVAAHEAGVIHRDIKPQNIMLDQDGRVKVMDFGIARLMADSARRLTQAGQILGTPAYMPPEQGMGWTCDARSDIYSLGVVLFQMLVGRLPYEAKTPILLLQKVLSEPPTVPDDISELPKGLMDYVLHMLAKDPRDRPQKIAEVERELGGMVARVRESDVASGKTPLPRKPLWVLPPSLAATQHEQGRPPRKRKIMIAAGVLVLVAAGGMTAMLQFAPAAKKSSNSTRHSAAKPAVPVMPAATPALPTETPTLSPTPELTPTPEETPSPEPTPPPATATPEATVAETPLAVLAELPKVTGIEFDRTDIGDGMKFSFKIATEPEDVPEGVRFFYKFDGQANETVSRWPVVMVDHLRAGDRTLIVTIEDAQGRRSEPFKTALSVRRGSGGASKSK